MANNFFQYICSADKFLKLNLIVVFDILVNHGEEKKQRQGLV